MGNKQSPAGRSHKGAERKKTPAATTSRKERELTAVSQCGHGRPTEEPLEALDPLDGPMGSKPSPAGRSRKGEERKKAPAATNSRNEREPGGGARPSPTSHELTPVSQCGPEWPSEEPPEDLDPLDGAAAAPTDAESRWAWSSQKGDPGMLLPGSVQCEADYAVERLESAGAAAPQSSAIHPWLPPAPGDCAFGQKSALAAPCSRGGQVAEQAALWPASPHVRVQRPGGWVQPSWPQRQDGASTPLPRSVANESADQPANVERPGHSKHGAASLSDFLQMQTQLPKSSETVSPALACRYASWPEGTQLQILAPLGESAGTFANEQPYVTLIRYDVLSNAFEVQLHDGTARVVPARQVRRAPWTVDQSSLQGHSTSLLAMPGGARARTSATFDDPDFLT